MARRCVTRMASRHRVWTRESAREYLKPREKRCDRFWSWTASRATLSLPREKLILGQKSVGNSGSGEIKARLVAMENVLFDKYMSIRRDAAMHDWWSLVASTAEARIVPARAAACGRETDSFDLTASYPKVMMVGQREASLDHSTQIETCSFEERAKFERLRRPVCICKRAVYGSARSGKDFTVSFAGWLIMDTVPEGPALHVLWHDDGGGGICRCSGTGGANRACESR